MRLEFIPARTAMTDASYQSGVVFHDPNSISYALTTTDNDLKAMAYAGAKILNFQRRWKYYRRMHRTIRAMTDDATPIPVIQDKYGYISTNTPTTTQIIGLVSTGWPSTITSTTPMYVGDVIVTYYVTFRGPKHPAQTG